jgi:phosphoribosyl-ATP pyrophosphohydrolase
MKALFERNYQAVVKRGKINEYTDDVDFIIKLKEEAHEAEMEIDLIYHKPSDRLVEEFGDCLVVCANWLIHRGVDLEEILTKIAEKNENRND